MSISKKIAAVVLIFLMGASSFAALPRIVEAAPAAPVADVLNVKFHVVNSIEQTAETALSGQSFLKEFTLDGIATGIAKSMLRSVVLSTLNWVSTGFEGSPAFVRDLNTTLLNVADGVVTHFANEIVNGAINSPFGNQIAEGVITGYYLYTSRDRLSSQLEYTLDRFSQNPSAFLYGDFSQGGWGAWYAANANCGNNPYCSQFAAHDELLSRIGRQVDQRIQELNWGDGFLSWRGDCVIASQGGTVNKNAAGIDLSQGDKCLQQEINTPGSFILAQAKAAGVSDIDQLVSADELNEALAGLLNSLLTKAISGNGLAGGAGNDRPGLQPGDMPNVSAGFSQTLTTQRDKVEQYQDSWETIGDAALGAKQQLEACIIRPGNSEVLENEVEPLIVRATAAAANSASAIATLNDLLQRATAAAANANAGFDQIIADYQALVASDQLPSALGIVEALSESQDSGDLDPPSLYTRMQEIARDACRQGNND